MMNYYYVTHIDKNGVETLKGFNLTKEEKDKLFYSFDSPSGSKTSSPIDEEEGKNFYGAHKIKYKSEKQAIKKLITEPKEFNNALKVLSKYGYVAFPKWAKTQSYQQFIKYEEQH